MRLAPLARPGAELEALVVRLEQVLQLRYASPTFELVELEQDSALLQLRAEGVNVGLGLPMAQSEIPTTSK